MSLVVALLVFALALSACGGGADDGSAARNAELIAAASAGDADRVRSLL